MFRYWQTWGWISIITPSSKYNNTRIRQTWILEISFLSFFLNKSSKLTNYNVHRLKSFSWNSRNGREKGVLKKGTFHRKFHLDSGTSYGNRIHFYDPTIHRLVPLVLGGWNRTIRYTRVSSLSLSSSTNPYFDPANIAGSKHSYIFRGENYARLDLLVGDRQA